MSDSPQNKIPHGISLGISSFLLIGSYALCCSAVLGRNAVFALLCTVVCSIFSVSGEKRIFAPSAILLVPLFIFSQSASVFYSAVSIFSGALVALLLKTVFKNQKIPDHILFGGALGLTLGATILLTNTYFGIGAFGTSPFEMLKNYRYLGFHPDFRGLLYGTITLFTMITYPFKFRKLNKYIPAEFISVAIPFVINVILNPDINTTSTNEYTQSAAFITLSSSYSDVPSLTDVLSCAFSYGIILFAIMTPKDNRAVAVNTVSGLLCGIPAERYSARGYNVISAITVTISAAAFFILCPRLIFRIPLPCVGAMLIVSAWQRLPYRKLSAVTREKNIRKLLISLICSVSFIVLEIPLALALCAVLAIPSSHRKKEGDK